MDLKGLITPQEQEKELPLVLASTSKLQLATISISDLSLVWGLNLGGEASLNIRAGLFFD